MTKPKYDKSSIKPPPPLSNKPPFRERKLISPRLFLKGLTVLRNATNFRGKRDKQNRETSRSL